MTNVGHGDVQTPSGKLSSGLRRGRKVDIIVGLDFGTSSTKAAYRELGAAGRRIRPIMFNHRLQGVPAFCSPSVGHVGPNRKFLWGPAAVEALKGKEWNTGIRRIKVLVAGEVDKAFCEEGTLTSYRQYVDEIGASVEVMRPANIAAVALANQMHAIRNIISQEYRGSEVDLRFNVCVPIEQIERDRVLTHYRRIHHVAEVLYRDWIQDGWDDENLLDMASAMFDEGRLVEDGSSRLSSVPEAMAQVASYITSLEAQRGVHAILDIGAGTSDLSIFDLTGPNRRETRCYWYAGRNLPYGAGRVEAAVADVLKGKDAKKIVTEAAVLAAMDGAATNSRVSKAIREELTTIWKKLRHTWAGASKRHKRRQGAWAGVPIFLCGGGAKLPGVREIFRKSWVPNWMDFAPRGLTKPDDFDDLGGKAPFDRMSVAYGLTFHGPELGDFVLPSKSPDNTPEIRLRRLPELLGDGQPG